jgi:hypothetical protein
MPTSSPKFTNLSIVIISEEKMETHEKPEKLATTKQAFFQQV